MLPGKYFGENCGSHAVHSMMLVCLFAKGKYSPEEDSVHVIIEPEGSQQCFFKYP